MKAKFDESGSIVLIPENTAEKILVNQIIEKGSSAAFCDHVIIGEEEKTSKKGVELPLTPIHPLILNPFEFPKYGDSGKAPWMPPYEITCAVKTPN